MSRSVLAVSALLVVLVACRDGPTQVATPLEVDGDPAPEPIVSVDALQAARDMLDDPFVRELMEREEVQFDLSPLGSGTGVLGLSRSLTAARDRLRREADGDGAKGDPDGVILRDILLLVLDDVVMLLESPSSSEEQGEHKLDEVQHEKRGAN